MQKFAFSTKSSRLNFPNKITTKDFEGWKQEQGCIIQVNMIQPSLLFYLQMIKGKPKNGALLIAIWKRTLHLYWVKFFRELPEGVTGAYKLL
jgi:hypothetical protein